MRLEGKIALVTGAARRVGRAIALALAGRGARVAVHYRSSREEAESLCKELSRLSGGEAIAVRADLSDPAAPRKLAQKIAKRFGAVHVLVNNASLYEKNPFQTTSLRDWDRHLEVNLRAPFLLSQAVAPAMRRAREGKIINIADWAALRPYAGYIPYCVSKAGLLCLTTALAKELSPWVQVNALMPGPVLLPESFTQRQRRAVIRATLVKRLGSPEDVARAALFLIEEDFITGAALPVDGGRLIA